MKHWQRKKQLEREAEENARYYRGPNPLCECGDPREDHEFVDFGKRGACCAKGCQCLAFKELPKEQPERGWDEYDEADRKYDTAAVEDSK